MYHELSPSPPGRPAQDYRSYQFSPRELARNLLLYLVLDLIISWLFFQSLPVALLFLPGCFLFLNMRRKSLQQARQTQMLAEFTTGMQLVSASLQAGYAVENAFCEALPELRKIYPPDSFVIREFSRIRRKLAVSVPIETLLLDLADRCQIDDIRNFAEVFQTAKRSGGDLMRIIRNTVTDIQEKAEVRQQIEADVSGKVLEQKVMSLVPILLIAYVNLTSPDFLAVCYETLAGRLLMTACLAIYLLAFLWGQHIMRIEV